MGDSVNNQYEPNYAILPGEVLSDELEMRNMSQQELSKRIGLSAKHIVSIIKGKSPITPETAIKLERAIGMPVNYWLNLESNYQEIKARLAEEEKLETDLSWLKSVPVNEMAKLEWIERHRDKKDQLREVLRFFGIASVDQWGEMWPRLSVAYRQSNQHETFPEAVSAWLRKGECDAASIDCDPYNKQKFRRALDEIRSLTDMTPNEFIPKMQALCAEAGVAIVFVPSLPKTGVSGATRWLHSNKAVIQLSLRYRSNDHLWFTFFHEAGHILLHGKKDLFLESTNKSSNGLDEQKELEANHFAQSELIPAKELDKFIQSGARTKAAICEFAEQVGIAPGIVVGQLQHRGMLDYKFCNDLKKFYQWAHETNS
ncbi:addiction module HigA family antidote [Marinobacter sp. LV10R520-4]|uniref:HigA family addiction module antitoxin n=1 Tax=Marinobacter sp. LV10R520-4 TaxID=1761796 RepID=UPI000BF2DCF3|nr:HigA family addiction module antitoxin [Marinobacter sp. LV10R520-4]PFG53563.1 addiction module HigA family antidote [Marinobacter sp. LV10R520-4]